mgnify:CR=1 FL=1
MAALGDVADVVVVCVDVPGCEHGAILATGDGGTIIFFSMATSFATAALGGEIEAPCLLGGENCDGKAKVMIKIPEGAQTGHTVRVKGRGMPSLRNPRQRGDLVVELFVETPTKLNARQKELMRELAGLCGDQQHPKSAGFSGKTKKFWEKAGG